jgi:4-hydroxy-4-methyl-2-oxoglutarate aldolase
MRMMPLREDLYDDDIHSFARQFHLAVGSEPAGKVLVVDSSGHNGVSVGGGTKLSRLRNLGLAGATCCPVTTCSPIPRGP